MRRYLATAAIIIAAVAIVPVATASHRALATRYGPPGDPPSRTATGLLMTPRTICFAHRTLPFHTKILFRWHGAKAVAPCLDRGPAIWTGASFDLSAGFVSLLEWRANWVPVYRGWHWVQLGLWNGKHGTWHKWRTFRGWKRIHSFIWSGDQVVYWHIVRG